MMHRPDLPSPHPRSLQSNSIMQATKSVGKMHFDFGREAKYM